MRRAANGEHAFFRLARREPATRQKTLVLLDAGPDQLGACRIVQLALLVLLVQRGEQRNQVLRWRPVQHPVDDSAEWTLDAQSVRFFLESRSGARSSPVTVDLLRSYYGSGFQTWLIGSPALVSAAKDLSFSVMLSERVDPDARLVDVELRAAGRQPRQLVLDLPEPRMAIRMIRNPFEDERPAPQQLEAPAVRSRLLFNPQGSRLSYRSQSHELVSMPIPHSGTPGRARRYGGAPGTCVIGAEWHTRRPFWLCFARGSIALRSIAPFPDGTKELSAAGPLVDAGDELWPIFHFHEQMLTFVAPDRSLWRVDFPSRSSRRIAEGVRAVLPPRDRSEHGLVLVEDVVDTRGGSGSQLLQILPFRAHPAGTVDVPRGCQAFLRRMEGADFGWILAHESEPRVWRFLSRSQRTETDGVLHAPRSASVVGVLRRYNGFVLLSDDRRELARATRNSSKVLLRSQAPITDVALAAAAPLLAYVTARGELGVMTEDGHVRVRGQLEER